MQGGASRNSFPFRCFNSSALLSPLMLYFSISPSWSHFKQCLHGKQIIHIQHI